MKVYYHVLMSVITEAIIKDRRDELIGELLITGKLLTANLEDDDLVNRRLDVHVSQTSHAVLKSIASLFKGELEVLEDGKVIELE